MQLQSASPAPLRSAKPPAKLLGPVAALPAALLAVLLCLTAAERAALAPARAQTEAAAPEAPDESAAPELEVLEESDAPAAPAAADAADAADADGTEESEAALDLLPQESESLRPAAEVADEAAAALGLLPSFEVEEEEGDPFDLSLLSVLDEEEGALDAGFWAGSDPALLARLLAEPPSDPASPALLRLLRRFLLSAPPPPEPAAAAGTADEGGLRAGSASSSTLAGTDADASAAAVAEPHLLWRVANLQALGMWRDLERLLSLLPLARLTEDDPDARRLYATRAEALVLAGRASQACEEADRALADGLAEAALRAGEAPLAAWLYRLRLACQLKEGAAPDVALLNLDLLRETDRPVPGEPEEEARARALFFDLAAARLGFGPPARRTRPSRPSTSCS